MFPKSQTSQIDRNRASIHILAINTSIIVENSKRQSQTQSFRKTGQIRTYVGTLRIGYNTKSEAAEETNDNRQTMSSKVGNKQQKFTEIEEQLPKCLCAHWRD